MSAPVSIITKAQEYSISIPHAILEVCYRSYEAIGNVIQLEIREIFKQGLFRSSWETDVRSISSVQTLLEKYQKGICLFVSGGSILDPLRIFMS